MGWGRWCPLSLSTLLFPCTLRPLPLPQAPVGGVGECGGSRVWKKPINIPNTGHVMYTMRWLLLFFRPSCTGKGHAKGTSEAPTPCAPLRFPFVARLLNLASSPWPVPRSSCRSIPAEDSVLPLPLLRRLPQPLVGVDELLASPVPVTLSPLVIGLPGPLVPAVVICLPPGGEEPLQGLLHCLALGVELEDGAVQPLLLGGVAPGERCLDCIQRGVVPTGEGSGEKGCGGLWGVGGAARLAPD